jgi:hypothetical protein
MLARVGFPRRLTVLGFCAIVIFFLIFGGAATVGALARGKESHLTPYVLIFVAVLVVVLIVVVLGVALFGNPMRLQLAEVSGPDYVDYERIRRSLGNSDHPHPVIEASPTRAIPQERAQSGETLELLSGDE